MAVESGMTLPLVKVQAQSAKGRTLRYEIVRRFVGSATAQISGPGAGEQVAPDEAKFLDRSRNRAYVVAECVTSG